MVRLVVNLLEHYHYSFSCTGVHKKVKGLFVCFSNIPSFPTAYVNQKARNEPGTIYFYFSNLSYALNFLQFMMRSMW